VSARRDAVEAARRLPDEPPCPTNTCPKKCMGKDFKPREVNLRVEEVISNAPPPYTQWNGRYGWQSCYRVSVNRSNCSVLVSVRLKVTGAITDAQKAAWKSAIEARWSGKVKFVCPDSKCPGACAAGYPVSVEVVYVTSGEHYEIIAGSPPSAAGGRQGMSGTTSMTGWGVDDTTDVTHEFGHMLGAPEEYFTTDGIDHTHGGATTGFRDDAGGNMNNPAHDPVPANYEKIRQQTALAMGRSVACTIERR
jgi:hypothetical protein